MSELSALDTAAAIRRGETTALQQCEAAIARIEARDGALNAVVVRDFDRAREQARAVDAGPQDLPLLGVPMTVKESYNLAGLPTNWGFTEHRDFIADDDAELVKRLKRAGAVILGKTNVPVGLADLQSNNPIYGRTHNAIDPTRSAGGSSGGAAVALASGMVPLEIGSDIGGSIRVPAAFNGVWGHKPTYDALSSDGHSFPRTNGARVALGVCGPMARNPEDLAAALDILSDFPLPRAAGHGVGDLRILLLTEHPLAQVQASIVAALEHAGTALDTAGARVDRSSDLLPDLTAQHRHYMHMLNIAMTRGAPSPGRDAPTLAEWFTLGDDQARCRRVWAALFTHYDAVIAPTVGMTAFPHDDTPLANRHLMIDGTDTKFGVQFAFPGLATFPMLPATSVPIGTDPDGLPIGVQVITDMWRDHDAIAIARTMHDLVWSK
ncbi:MAG: amidase family protein [Pseudomonadota bacterium]